MSGPLVDLTACDVEPIHVPGTIQPHGALLALAEPELNVAQASANLGAMVGVDVDAALGRPVGEALGREAAALVANAVAANDPTLDNPLRLEVAGRVFDGVVHRNGRFTLVELEPMTTPLAASDRVLRNAMTHLQRAATVDALCNVAAQQIRALTGFDRVMVYRFHSDGHGEVVAEDRAHDTDPLLELHFPASDIPRQARQLYLLNPIRVIPDARYTPVPLRVANLPAARVALDLTFASLRAVSPVHLEYLANMRVAASMSVSLICGGKLWGLLACHHRVPRLVPFTVRSACEVVGKLASLQIDGLEERTRRGQREALRGGESVLIDAMRSAPHGWADALVSRPEALLDVVHATGAAVLDESGVRTAGETPSKAEIASIAAWLGKGRGAFATHALARHLEGAAAYASVASGLLAIRVQRPRDAFILWFRQEIVRTTVWGGDPLKPVTTSPDDGRIHPRNSFGAWKEIVRGTSTPWTLAEMDVAEDIVRRAIEVDLEQQIVRAEQAVRTRDDVVAVVSHDLKNPLNVIQMATQLLRFEAQEPKLVASLDRITRASNRMNGLITDLLDLAKIEAGRFHVHVTSCGARELVADAVSLLAPEAQSKSITLESSRVAELKLVADRDRLLQVFTNLVGNAIKFTPAGGTVEVGGRPADGFARFEVRDNGAGIAAGVLPRVFDRYWQAPNSPVRGGSGLGLYIAKGLVEAHGGRIWAENCAGGGSVFAFTIPLG